MNKQERIIVAILTITLLGAFYVAREDGRKQTEYLRYQQQQAEIAQRAAAEVAQSGERLATEESVLAPKTETALTAPVREHVDPVTEKPEQTIIIGNDVAVLTLTTKGGGITSAKLLAYDKTKEPADGPVELDFSDSPALTLTGLPGFAVKQEYSIAADDLHTSAVLTATNSTGLVLERKIAFIEGYKLSVQDTLFNGSGEAVDLSGYTVGLGPMRVLAESGTDTDLAIDTKAGEEGKTPVIEIVRGTKEFGFAALFNASGGGCKAPLVSPTAPETVSFVKPGDVYWASARERFFIQVLTPTAGPAAGLAIRTARDIQAPGGALVIQSVASGLVHADSVLAAGDQAVHHYSFYIGPRKLSELRKLGEDYTKIMRFGTWSFFCRALLDLLNFLYNHVFANYGVAIILLTVLVRLVLYPINKRNAENMRKMQKVQPFIKEVQEKYKDDPKKLQAETMRIYGEHKVNPLSSCLPMLIQLPVFIALFTVLRSAVELRYASFLWIADLSQPENLFRDIFPWGVNFLPIAMAGTMALQSYLTPTAGDPSQQKMMMVMMPAMMLIMFYRFPAALGLYWTVSQMFAIAGLLRTRATKKKEDSPVSSVSPPPRETRQMRREKARDA